LDTVFNGAEFRSAKRIYIGDEFCPHRLPHVNELKFFFDFARKTQSSLTLLTPFFTDEELEKYGAVFDYLERCPVEIQVVANDLGFLRYIKDRYPSLPMAVGRLLNRGFKDPRLPDKTMHQQVSEEQRSLLTDCTFLQPEFQGLMKGLGIERVERDLLPYDKGDAFGIPEMDTSVYFPYGYFTTGRVCWVSSFNRLASRKFVPGKDCTQPCNDLTFLSRDNESPFRIVQNGNTFFYRYTLPQLFLLLKTARSRNLRMVYQGFAL
jgi:hypothetical protein